MHATRPAVISLGCRLNLAESEAIRAQLGDRDTVVVNSCAVTGEAVKQTRAAIRRARRERPTAELVVTGCAATIDPAGFAAMAEVDRVVANEVKASAASWTAEGDARPRRASPVVAFAGHARAFVEVQNGCDHACTFCIIPQGRGTSRSAPVALVVERVRGLVAAGHREVVLTGVDVTSYAPSLGTLVERVLTETSVARLRLSSLDSVEIDERLFELIVGEPRVMPHLHLSLQAGNDLVLKRMKRRHLRAQAVGLVERIKARRDVAIGADLIAGFPTETAEMFADTLALIADCQIVHAHIFPYSPRAGTPAARMPQVEPEVRRERAARLREAAGARKAAWLKELVGSVQDVLVERPGDRGYAPNFAEVRMRVGDTPLQGVSPGEIVRARVTGAAETHLVGEPA